MHHFTKTELAAERILIILVVCMLFAAAGLAATVILPTRATLLNCGSRAELPQRCREEERCCLLIRGYTPRQQGLESSDKDRDTSGTPGNSRGGPANRG